MDNYKLKFHRIKSKTQKETGGDLPHYSQGQAN